MSVNLLDFNISVGRKKPRTIPGMPNQSTCPFCDVQNLTGILAPEGSYEVVLNTDDKRYGGFGLADDSVRHFTRHDPLYADKHIGWLMLYIPARSAVVLRKV